MPYCNLNKWHGDGTVSDEDLVAIASMDLDDAREKLSAIQHQEDLARLLMGFPILGAIGLGFLGYLIPVGAVWAIAVSFVALFVIGAIVLISLTDSMREPLRVVKRACKREIKGKEMAYIKAVQKANQTEEG